MKKHDPQASGDGAGGTLGDGWDDDLSADSLDISRGGSMEDAQSASASAYAGGGVGFGDDDDPFADDVPQGALELDLPSHHTANSPRSIPVADPPRSMPAGPGQQGQGSVPSLHPGGVPSSRPNLHGSGPASSQNSMPAPQSGPSLPAPGSQPSLPAPGSQPQLSLSPHASPPRDPSAMIARYPAPPSKVWETPVYALKVAWRQFELRQDLESLRKKRSPDVALYERALKTHDPKMFTLGLVITCAILVVATFIFFLPVTLRFLGDPI